MLNLFWRNSNLYQPKFSNIALNMFESIESILRNLIPSVQSVQLLSCVQLFATPWTAARQASLSITNSWSLLKIMSIASVMPSNHLIFCHWWCRPTISSSVSSFSSCLQSFPASECLIMSQVFASGGQRLELQLQHQCFQWIFRVDLL